MELKSFYESRVSSLTSDISSLRRRNRLFVTAELTTFIAAIASVVVYTVNGGMSAVIAALLLFAAYIIARRLDVRNGERMSRLTALRTVYENELRYLGGDFSRFDDGRRYADPQHPYTFDMDIFGPQSLFHRINRTVTSGGSDRLACLLSNLPVDGDAATIATIDGRRETIDRLATLEPLRSEFVSRGTGGHIDTAAVLTALDTVRHTPLPRFAGSPVVPVIAAISLAGFLATILLSVFTPMTSGVPVLWATIQLFVVLALCNAPLRAIGKTAGRLHREMRAYCELIGILVKNEEGRVKNTIADGRDNEERGVSDSSLSTLRSSLSAFDSLRRILDSLDRRGNFLGLILFDIFLLHDIFLVRRFYRWRRDYIERIGEWIGQVSEADALISMATFRYNEPAAGRAEIVSSPEVVYEGRGLWHPFLGAKAVRNDFTIADSHYYIVTGANMAGKSTFLRSLGVNYILAMNGMPVFAERLRVSLFSLFSSMRTTDDLAHGISYFNAELLRLQQLIDHCRGHRRTLIILDEILKGTNSLDKLNGSRMFLDAISSLPVSGVIATHDLELSRMADNGTGLFHNWCFEIQLADKITYTYKITPGVARNQNATYLLRNILSF